MKSKMKKKRPFDYIFNVVIIVILSCFTLLCIYPIYYVFIYSISNPTLAQTGITLMAKGFSLESYKAVFAINSLSMAFLISIIRTVLGAGITVIVCGFFAYLMTQEDMPCRKLIYRFMIITMYVGGGLIPSYLLIKKIGLIDNFLVYIIPSALSAFNVILIKTFLESLPKSLEESAQLDGAGFITIFFRIIIPISIPILATIAVFSAVGQWGSWFDNLLYINNPKLDTIQYVLYKYLNEAQALADKMMETNGSGQENLMATLSPESVKMAITMIVIIPILMVYPFMQKFFVKGIMIGAVKG